MRAIPILCLGLLASQVVLADQDDKARELFRRGKEYYSQGQYEEAIGAFKSAAEIRPSPLLEYNIGRCYDKLGNPSEAIASYERYLKGKPYAANREKVRQRIEELKKELATRAGPPTDQSGDHPPEAPTPAAPPPAPAPTPAPEATPEPAPMTPPLRSEEPGMSSDGPPHEAAGGATASAPRPDRRASPSPRRRDPYRAPGKREAGPLYKQWWFWAGCVGAAVIVGFIIATAASHNDADTPPAATGGLHFSF